MPSASLWFDSKVECDMAKLSEVSQHYMSPAFAGKMESKTYRQAIRNWLNEATGGKKRGMAQGLSFPKDIMMMLLATIEFKAQWGH